MGMTMIYSVWFYKMYEELHRQIFQIKKDHLVTLEELHLIHFVPYRLLTFINSIRFCCIVWRALFLLCRLYIEIRWMKIIFYYYAQYNFSKIFEIILLKNQYITVSNMETTMLLGSLLLQVRSIICDPTWSNKDPSWRPVSIFESVLVIKHT